MDSPSVDEPSRRRETYMNLSELNIVRIFSVVEATKVY